MTPSPTPAGWSDLHDPRRNNFDLLRFLLAAVVVFSHSYTIVLPRERWDAEPLMALTGRQLSLGTMAVFGFFAISGFLIAQSWTRSRSFGLFLKRRALRIYPGFAAMTLACVFLVVPLATGAFPKIDVSLLGKIAYRVAVFDAWEDPAAFSGQVDPAINASAWTIPYEFWCYLFLAAVGTAGAFTKRWGVAALAVLFAVFYGLHEWFFLTGAGPVWADWLPKSAAYHAGRVFGCPAMWPRFLTYFVAGALFFAGRSRVPHSGRLAAACATVLVATAAAKPLLGLPLLSFALPVCGVYLLFWVALHPAVRFERFGARGDVSYGLYLYAFPIQQLLVKWIGPATVTPTLLFAYSLPPSLAAELLSWHFVEKRFLGRRHKAAESGGRAEGATTSRPSIASAGRAAIAATVRGALLATRGPRVATAAVR